MGATYCIVLRKNYIRKADGKSALYVRIINNRKVKYYHTREWVRPPHWLGSKVSVRDVDHRRINIALAELLLKAKELFSGSNFDFPNKLIDGMNADHLSIDELASDFYTFFKTYINERKGRISHGTYRNYLGELSKLKKFRPVLGFKDIDVAFVNAYDAYMRTTLQNSPNTISKTFRGIKVVVKEALEQGKIKVDPFKYYKMPRESSKREYLTWNEVLKIEKLKGEAINENMRKALNAFLFGCYTGLRYQDIRDLENAQINDGMIVLRMSKTKEIVSIPLTKKAASLISHHDGRIFRVFNNTRMNSYLKLAAKRAGIKKKVTFHVSRHTFATLSLNLGIPLEVVSKLLGHTDIRTTQIYAKLMDKTKVDMMRKWDEMN